MGRKKKRRRAREAVQETPALRGVALLLSEMPAASLDLHGLTAAQASPRVRDFLRTQASIASGRVVHIITGRGNRSEGMPVLPGLVNAELGGRLAEFVAERAGLPGGGGVAVRLR